MIDAEKLGEGAGRGVGFLSRQNGVAKSLVAAAFELANEGLVVAVRGCVHVRIPGHRERRFQPKVNIHSKAS